MDITVTRKPNDGFVLSTIHQGYLVQRRYIGYAIREAKRLFRHELKVECSPAPETKAEEQ